MDRISSTKPPKPEGDPEAEAAEAADAAYASMLALLSGSVILHDDVHTVDDKSWLVVTDKNTDEPHCPGCSQPTRVRLVCGRRRPTSARQPHHAAFLRFEWGHTDQPLAALELRFEKGTWTIARTTDPGLVNWPGLKKLEPLAGGTLRRNMPLTISEEVAAKVADWLVRTFKHHRALEAVIGLGPPD